MYTSFIPYDLTPDNDSITVHEVGLGCFIISGPLNRDFGPYCKGEVVLMELNLEKGTCTVYDTENGIDVLSAHLLQPLNVLPGN